MSLVPYLVVGDVLLYSMLALVYSVRGDTKLWSQWWSYKGISGPDYWGLLNQDWSLCTRGQHQSPVDINPRNLVFDPNLRPVRMDAHPVDGYIVNTGHDITIHLNESNPRPFAFTGGPLSYTYRVHHIKLHFGSLDLIGSEHTIGGKAFPLELQIYGYNTELFSSFQDAMLESHGVAAVALFGNIGPKFSSELDLIIEAISRAPYKHNSTPVLDFFLTALLPETHDYMTYDGSMTQPGCLETVTWIVFNKPFHVKKEQLASLRRLHQVEDVNSAPLLMENNFRPPMPVNRRTVRTNIKPDKQAGICGAQKLTFYEVNTRYLLT